jgi:hypothetical protein
MKSVIRLFPALITVTLLFMAGCRPESTTELGAKAKASFTMSPVAGRVNTFLLTSTSENAFGYQWDKGNGSFVKGKAIDTAYFPLHGTFRVNLRAFGRGGYDTASQSVVITVDDILSNPVFQMLTARSWKLNPAAGANAIIVGTEGNPGQYFGGGALADCQIDDIYTFSTGLTLNYNAAGATFNAGNLAPNYTCSTDRTYTGQAYTFTPGVTAGAGLATITLPGVAVPTRFIGVTDVSSNFYRVISVSATSLVLRSGTTTETVHQFKFIPQ